jgi:hypothetical protein
MKQCDSYSTTVEAQCCYVEGHSGECFYSRQDETDRIRWKLAADERDRWRAQFVALRSDLARVTQERDALAGQLTTAVRDARATAAGDIQRAEAERDAALSDLAKMDKEQNELHALLKAVVDFALDEAGFPASAMIGPDAPLRIVRKLHADLTAMRHRAERAEAELAEARKPRTLTDDEQRAVAERIAAWLDDLHPSAWKMRDFGVQNERVEAVAKMLAADIRAGAWRKETT